MPRLGALGRLALRTDEAERIDVPPYGMFNKAGQSRSPCRCFVRLQQFCSISVVQRQCRGLGDAMTDFVIEEGLPYPLGAHWSGKGTNFAIFSANAAKVEVCLFDGEREIHRFELPEYT